MHKTTTSELYAYRPRAIRAVVFRLEPEAQIELERICERYGCDSEQEALHVMALQSAAFARLRLEGNGDRSRIRLFHELRRSIDAKIRRWKQEWLTRKMTTRKDVR